MQGINPPILMPSINFDKLILNKIHFGIFFCQITKKIWVNKIHIGFFSVRLQRKSEYSFFKKISSIIDLIVIH